MKKSNGFHSTRAIQCFLQQDQIKYYSVESRSSDLKGFFKDKQPMDFWARSGGGLAPTRLAGFLSAIWSFPPRPFCGCAAAIVDSRLVLHPPNPVAATGMIWLQAADWLRLTCRIWTCHAYIGAPQVTCKHNYYFSQPAGQTEEPVYVIC